MCERNFMRGLCSAAAAAEKKDHHKGKMAAK